MTTVIRPTTPLSAADVAAHEAASYVRPLPRRVPVAPSSALSTADLNLTTEIAYLELDRQRAEQVAFEQATCELAAGGIR